MNTKNSTLGLFALKSYVSVLPETEKETALKIVGGWGPDDDDCYPYEGLNIYDCSSWYCIDDLLEGGEDFGRVILVDEDGNVIGVSWDDDPGGNDRIFSKEEWEQWKEENPCLAATNYR